MNKSKIAWICCVGVLLIFPISGIAQQKPAFRYDVKFICGRSDGKILSAGTYRTAVNVYNPGDTVAVFRKRFAVALPGEKAGPVTDYHKGYLESGTAMEIDCEDIYEMVRSKVGFLKGFVTIESDIRLEVVAVYTAGDEKQNVRSIDVEHISPELTGVGGCADLKVGKIGQPEWDGENHRSIIQVTILNIGDQPAGPSKARITDPDKSGPDGTAVVETPAMGPGGNATVTFYLNYWVYDPDATLEVTVDYMNQIDECREDNNVMIFEGKG